MRSIVLSAAVLVAGCTPSRPLEKASPPAAEIAADDAAPRAPLLVRWQLVSDANGSLKVEAVLERRVTLRTPVTVQIEVPAGLQLVSGQTALEIPAGAAPGSTSLPLEFRYAGTPPDDLRLVADSAGAKLGVHAVASYRFGRPEPAQARPTPSGPSLKAGGLDLGPSVQIKP
jgi:hypothetical protein